MGFASYGFLDRIVDGDVVRIRINDGRTDMQLTAMNIQFKSV